MVAKAREAQNKAKKIEAAGQHQSASILINGLIDWVDDEVSVDSVMQQANLTEENREVTQKVINIVRKDLKKAFEDAKKQLNKKMSESMDMKDMAADILGKK